MLVNHLPECEFCFVAYLESVRLLQGDLGRVLLVRAMCFSHNLAMVCFPCRHF
jgi:hypothetical protein